LLTYHKHNGALLLGLKLVEARTKAKLAMPVLALEAGFIPDLEVMLLLTTYCMECKN
jgi:hypothetical protein